jgi:DNA-binding response OmpR family regulator
MIAEETSGKSLTTVGPVLAPTMNVEDHRAFDDEYVKGFPIMLLVEDNVLLRNLMLRALQPMPFAVLVAADGQEAIEISRSFEDEITMLVTDLGMPRIAGGELTQLMLRERPGIRILQMSAAESFGNPHFAFLQKPFTAMALARKIQDVMRFPADIALLVSSRMNSKDFRVFDEDAAKGLPVILLAEENVMVRNLLLRVLHPASFAVLVAANGKEAMEISRAIKGEIAVLVTDMEMPHMGGDELGELIMKERPGIRILQMSGELVETVLGRNLSLAFIQKPFTAAVLLDKIREVIAAPAGSRRLVGSVEQIASSLR